MDQSFDQSAYSSLIPDDTARYIIENANMAIIVAQDLILKYANAETEILTGYTREELLAQPFLRFVHPDDHELLTNRHNLRLQGAHIPNFYDFRMLNKKGEIRWVGIKAARIKWKKEFATLCFLQDITAFKKAREEINAISQQWYDIVEFQPDPTFVIDKEKKVIVWNKAMEELTGINKKSIIGQGDYAYSLPFYNERRPILIDLIFKPMEEIKSLYSYVKSDGEKLFVEIFVPHLNNGVGMYLWGIASPLYNQHGQRIGAIETIRDITEIKKTEKRLQDSERRFRQIAENVSDGFWVVDVSSQRFIYSNPALDAMYGFPLVGRSVEEIFAFVHFDDREIVRKERSGNKNFESTYRIRKQDGSERWLQTNGFYVADDQGKIIRQVGITRDITEGRLAAQETERVREHMMQADKMVTLGILVSGVAHEINNPNNYLMLNAKIIDQAWNDILPILEKHHEKTPGFKIANLDYGKARVLLPDIIKGFSDGTQRIKRIVESLRNYARKDTDGLNQDVDLNAVVESALVLLSDMLLKSTDNFQKNLDATLPRIRGNTSQIEQVVINLLTNACQSLNNRNQKIILTTCWGKDGVVLEIIDHGCGIPSENASKIFDPFFTTKRESGGTGLGLSISKNIMQNHGGTIEIQSEPGKGTVVRLTFPITGRINPILDSNHGYCDS